MWENIDIEPGTTEKKKKIVVRNKWSYYKVFHSKFVGYRIEKNWKIYK